MPPDPQLIRALDKIDWRLAALDRWRETVDARLGVLERGVQDIVNQDKIQAAVTAALDRQGQKGRLLSLTKSQTRLAWAALGITLAGSAIGWVELLSHHL